MKLKQLRSDLKFVDLHAPHDQVDANGCVTCQVVKRFRHLISWAEAVLSDEDIAILERREARVMKDAEKKS